MKVISFERKWQQRNTFPPQQILRLVSSYSTWQVLQVWKVLQVFLHPKLQHSVNENERAATSIYPYPYKCDRSQCTQAWYFLCDEQTCIYHVVAIVTCTFSLTRLTASPLYLPFPFTPPSFLCQCFNSPRTGFSNSFAVRILSLCYSPRCSSRGSNQVWHKQLLPLGMCNQLYI